MFCLSFCGNDSFFLEKRHLFQEEDQQEHGADGKNGTEHDKLPSQFVITAHLLSHGEG